MPFRIMQWESVVGVSGGKEAGAPLEEEKKHESRKPSVVVTANNKSPPHIFLEVSPCIQLLFTINYYKRNVEV